MLENDINDKVVSLRQFAWFRDLDTVRQEVMTDMAFNLGVRGVMNFKKMIAALEAKDYTQAAAEMLDSTWQQEVGDRARELAAMMIHGTYQEV